MDGLNFELPTYNKKKLLLQQIISRQHGKDDTLPKISDQDDKLFWPVSTEYLPTLHFNRTLLQDQ